MFAVNFSLLPAKGHYFAFFASNAGILPFMMTIASQFGASPALIGVMYSTLPFFMMVAKPLFGILADEFQQRKSIFLSCVALMTSAFFAMYFIPPVEETSLSKGLRCRNGSLALEMCNLPLSADAATNSTSAWCRFNCEMPLGDPIFSHICHHTLLGCPEINATEKTQSVTFESEVDPSHGAPFGECVWYALQTFQVSNLTVELPGCADAMSAQCKIKCDNNYLPLSEPKETGAFDVNVQIIYLWVLMIIACMFMGTATSMGDTIVLGLLPHHNAFGRQRLFGAIGFGLTSVIAGMLVDFFSVPGGVKNFAPGFFTVLIMGVLDIAIGSRMTVKKTEKPKNLFGNVCRLFLKPETLLFTIAVFFIGLFCGVLWTFLIVYLVNLGANQLLIGLTMGVQCLLGEIPFMFISGWFLKKLGHFHAMTLVLAVFGVRFLLYSVIINPWLVLPIETSQGICYGIFFTALATYSSIIAPPSSQATMQGILQAVFEGLGTGTGCLLGGLYYQAVGGKTMWLVMGTASCVIALVHGLALVVIQRSSRKKASLELQIRDVANGGDVPKEMMSQMLPADERENTKQELA